MANERLYQFPSKATPVPADILYAGDSANAYDEVQITISGLISAYPTLIGIGGLTLGNNTYPYVNGSGDYTAGSISNLAVSFLANDGYTTTATAAGTTTLTSASTIQQFFTGTTTQTVALPVTSTMILGQSFYIVNNSTGAVTVQSSGGNTIQTMASNTTLLVTCISLTGTGTASWYADYNFQTALTLPLSVANGGTGTGSVVSSPTATAWAGWDANKNLSANNVNNGYTTTATAASTTTLTVSSTFYQYFTGSTTQTVALPVTSTLALGQSFYIVNNSTGAVTVQSSGGNTVQTMAANTYALVTCILTSGTTAASWNVVYDSSDSGYLPIGGGTLTGNLAFNPSTDGITGTSTNDNAASGVVGQIISSVIASGSAISLTSSTPANVTSLSLPAGDWDVFGNVSFTGSGLNIQSAFMWSSTTSATNPDQSLYNGLGGVAVTNMNLNIPTVRYSFASTTTVYLSCSAAFTSTATACGGIYARRRR